MLIDSLVELGSFEGDHHLLWLTLGDAYHEGGLFDQAEGSYKQAAALNPSDSRAYLSLGTLYHERDRFREAEAIYQKAFQMDPDNPDLLNGLGYLYADWGVELDEAEVLVRRALLQRPRNGAYLDSLGWIYAKKGRLQEALSLLEEACLYESDPQISEHLGHVYLLLGNPQSAQETWEKALGSSTTQPELKRKLEADIKTLQIRKDR